MGVMLPMRRRYYRPKQRFRYVKGPASVVKRIGTGLTLVLFFAGLCMFLSGAAMFLNHISCRIAVSDACDIVTAQVMLTSSHVEFQNNVVTAGINQTKHQINLEVVVDIDVLIPWDTESAQVVTEVLIADVVVVGKVPETYLNMQ